ncbi:Serine/threonine-protein kinase pkn1 [Candidatus Electrothrix laxa]
MTAIGILLAGSAALITALHYSGVIDFSKLNTLLLEKWRSPNQGDIMIEPAIGGMEFVYIPEGCFMMGSPYDEKNHQDDEGSVHKVCIDGFWMGKYEVTQGQWQKIMGSNPANFQKGARYPVENVSWNDTQDFIKKLNSSTGKKYRLPTEAEWEYACRANDSGQYCGGDNVDDLAWYSENSDKSTHPVGKKRANNFDLHDMSGNVVEWCADWYDSDYYSSSPEDNPTGPSSGLSRVIRGGTWAYGSHFVRSADRFKAPFSDSSRLLGFRLTLPVQ